MPSAREAVGKGTDAPCQADTSFLLPEGPPFSPPGPSRRLERAMELATALKASALPFEQREERLSEFDVIVGSTSAPTTVISAETVQAAMSRRPARPLFFIDLALPRDIDPRVADRRRKSVAGL